MKIEYEPSQQGFTLVEIMIVVAIIGLLAAIGIPSFLKARDKSLTNSKTANCTQIEAAIARYAMDAGVTNGETVAWDDISPYLREDSVCDYDVGGKTLDTCTFKVGAEVSYRN